MKNIKGFEEYINEATLNQNSLNQLERIRKLSKGTDIGDRIDKMKGTNLIWQQNAIDHPIETFEEFHRKNQSFKINQNVRDFHPNR